MISAQPPVVTRNRKETLIPKETDEMIEVLSVVGDITNVMTIDPEHFVEVMTSSSGSTCSSELSPDSSGVRPRKRAKLDHLSADEKAQHRKMMNRISAQSARDRQKQQMQIQEVQIKNLVTTNDNLRKENESLANKCGNLTSENDRLSNLLKEYEAKFKVLESFGATMQHEIKSEPMEHNTSEECGNVEESKYNGSLEPAVPRTVPLPWGPEPLKNFSCLLLLWTCFQWISTHPNSSKLSTTLRSKSLVQEICSLVDSKQPSLQTRQLLQSRLTELLKSVKMKEPG